MQIRELRSENKTIKRTADDAAAARRKKFAFEFYCISIAENIAWTFACGRFAILLRLFVHRDAFSLERIKLCGLHQRRSYICYMAPFDAQQGLFLSVDVHQTCAAYVVSSHLHSLCILNIASKSIHSYRFFPLHVVASFSLSLSLHFVCCVCF